MIDTFKSFESKHNSANKRVKFGRHAIFSCSTPVLKPDWEKYNSVESLSEHYRLHQSADDSACTRRGAPGPNSDH
jgi:hypothetical protein